MSNYRRYAKRPPQLTSRRCGERVNVAGVRAHFMSGVIKEAATAGEAVAVLLHHMPSGRGPVTISAAPRGD